MKILSSREMKSIDSCAIQDYKIPGLILMENAGIRTVDIIKDVLQDCSGKKVVVLVGKGNNGGDGLVIARHLINAGAKVEVFLMTTEDKLTPDSRVNYDCLRNMSDNIQELLNYQDLDSFKTSVSECHIIVDAIYGIGFKGSMGNFETEIVKIVNKKDVPVIAVDIPSGVEADTGRVWGEAIKATHTVTFALPKIGLVLEPGTDYTGQLHIVDISIPAVLANKNNLMNNIITEDLIKPIIRPRSAESHKGTYGHTLIIGGSLGMSGAVIMASYAALRSGAGLVTAALPESIVPIVEAELVEVMTAPLAQTSQAAITVEALPAIEKLLQTSSVCAIGPGMSTYAEAHLILRFILEHARIPLVIDADGLNALAEDISVLKDRQIPVVLTPHPGEMARLTGKSVEEIQADRINTARFYAQEWGAIVVLKGNKTVVADPSGQAYININGNPGMATAGSGDVLCGIIAGLISQGIKPRDAAIAGVYLHGETGDYVADFKGQRGLIAGDLIKYLPDILYYFEQL